MLLDRELVVLHHHHQIGVKISAQMGAPNLYLGFILVHSGIVLLLVTELPNV